MVILFPVLIVNGKNVFLPQVEEYPMQNPMSIPYFEKNANILKKKGGDKMSPPFSPKIILHIVLELIFLHLTPYMMYNCKLSNNSFKI